MTRRTLRPGQILALNQQLYLGGDSAIEGGRESGGGGTGVIGARE